MNKIDNYKIVQTETEVKLDLAKRLFLSIASYFKAFDEPQLTKGKRMENIVRGQLLCVTCRQTLDFITEQTPAVVTLQSLLSVALDESTKKLKGDENKLKQVIELMETVANYNYDDKIG